MDQTQELYLRAKKVIPGGVQLLSKRPEMMAPGRWPGYAQKAKGCEVWDLDGNHYYDMTTNGIGACVLGYADPDVTRAVEERIENGSMSSLNCPEEVYLAERLCEIHPWAQSVRFARTGGETCAVAVRIARATTGRDLVAICGYHGWSDWYLAANLASNHELDGCHLAGLEPSGVPKGLTGSALTFNYGDRDAFRRILAAYGDRLACVIMEPVRHELPKDDFLFFVKEGTHQAGALLIYDEITIGWRLTFGGSHKLLGIEPDIATFGKAMGNGFPIGAVIGTREAMDGAQISFISSTFWTEGVGPAASLAAIKKMEEVKIWEFVNRAGEIVMNDWRTLGDRHGLEIESHGIPCLATFSFKKYPLECKTLYTVLMLKEGFLGNNAFYPTLAHTDEVLALYREAIDQVFAQIAATIRKGGREAVLEAIGGPVCQTDFQRLLD